ncbi:MAG: hypothetical protein P1U65_17140 [Minwuia sp.]|nr:hypothetical protein [Minwuia sp.]
MTIVAAFSLIILLYFVYVGINSYVKIQTQRDFFLLGKHLNKKQFSGSFAASSTSLATALIFFVTLGSFFGIPILLAPLTYFLGALLFAKFINKRGITDTLESGTSLFQFLSKTTRSSNTSFMICLVPALGVLSILLIELYVGVSIFSVFAAPGTVNLQLSLAFVSAIILLYTAIGGFPAVVRTDLIQWSLIWLGALTTLGICLYLVITRLTETASIPKIDWFPNPMFGDGFVILPIAITANVIVVNIFLQFTQLRTWQMVAASESIQVLRVGIVNGAFSTALLWSFFAIVGIVSGPLLGLDTQTIDAFLRSMARSESPLIAYIALPIFFVACLSALISTADSALLPLSQFVCEKSGIDQSNLLLPRIWIAIFLLIANGMYYVIFTLLGYNFLQLLFTIFGLVIVTGPVVITALFAPEVMRLPIVQKTAVLSVYAGATAIVLVSYFSSPMNVAFGAPVGFLLTAAVMSVIVYMNRNSQI